MIPIPIVIPLHHGGGKLSDNSELRFALRSLENYFVDPFEVVVVSRDLPAGFQGLKHLPCDHGLKSALRVAAAAYPAGFFWYYDDCTLLRDTTAAEMKITPACRGWRKAKTGWAKSLERIHQRLEKEGHLARDYSRPHGPYWFDKAMVDEAIADWPGMTGKFPWESWILSKRRWACSHGMVKQYYGAFRGEPAAMQRYVNYNNKGFSPELRGWLEKRFPEPSRFEVPPPVRDRAAEPKVQGVVIRLKNRPRWEGECVERCARASIDLTLFDGVDGHAEEPTVSINHKAFRMMFGRAPLAGEIGCFNSHVNVARAFGALPPLAPGFEDWRLVLEDDASPHGIDAGKILDRAEEAERKRFDFVFLHAGRGGDLPVWLQLRADGDQSLFPRAGPGQPCVSVA